ncbi:MAG TPA: hypothetical protein VM554_00985 [Acidisarcina sp.]|nr:hypothetical protein [Acidisarcina sp.]
MICINTSSIAVIFRAPDLGAISGRWVYLALFAVNLALTAYFGPTLSARTERRASHPSSRKHHVL